MAVSKGHPQVDFVGDRMRRDFVPIDQDFEEYIYAGRWSMTITALIDGWHRAHIDTRAPHRVPSSLTSGRALRRQAWTSRPVSGWRAQRIAAADGLVAYPHTPCCTNRRTGNASTFWPVPPNVRSVRRLSGIEWTLLPYRAAIWCKYVESATFRVRRWTVIVICIWRSCWRCRVLCRVCHSCPRSDVGR